MTLGAGIVLLVIGLLLVFLTLGVLQVVGIILVVIGAIGLVLVEGSRV